MKLALAIILPLSVFGCTTIIVGKDASADGSVMCTHSDDGESNPDARIVRVPGVANIAAGAKRNIFWDTEDYPRHVGDKRGVKECVCPLPSTIRARSLSLSLFSPPSELHSLALLALHRTVHSSFN